jgi:hypothetical protein
MHRGAVLLYLAVASVTGAPAVALAHARPSDTGPIETSALSVGLTSWIRLSDASNGWAIFVAGCALVGLLAIRARRCWRTPVVALAFMLTLTGFETAIHSVHHLGDSQAAERCLVASSGAHTHAIDDGSALVSAAVTRALGPVAIAPRPAWRSVVTAPPSGRAPPA